MALTDQQRVRLARVLNADLTIRQITGDEKVVELLRLIVLPPQQQDAQIRQAIARVRATLQDQQADAPAVRESQDQTWTRELAGLDEIEAGL